MGNRTFLLYFLHNINYFNWVFSNSLALKPLKNNWLFPKTN